jgi:uncharacterized membrane protein YfcA
MDLLHDPAFMALALLGAMLLGLSKSGFFGLGVISMPMLSLIVPPLQAAAIFLPVSLTSDVITVWSYRRTWSGWNLAIMIPSMIVGMVAGWLMAAVLTAAHIRLAVGVIAALFVLRQWLNRFFESHMPKPNTVTGVVFGAIGGFTTMLANAGSPAWQMHLLPQRIEKLSYVGTVTILFAVSNALKVPAFANLGYLTTDNLLIGCALIPVAVVANYLGLWLVRKTSPEMFFRIAYVLMFFIALELIRGAVMELWWK